MEKHCAFCEESTKLRGCVDFDTSMNIWGRLFEGRLALTVDKSNLNHTPIYLVND